MKKEDDGYLYNFKIQLYIRRMYTFLSKKCPTKIVKGHK